MSYLSQSKRWDNVHIHTTQSSLKTQMYTQLFFSLNINLYANIKFYKTKDNNVFRKDNKHTLNNNTSTFGMNKRYNV